MNCIILLLLLCCQSGCGNGVAGNSNCCCEKSHNHHHHNNCNRERREDACEAVVSEDTCDCMERDVRDAASMAPPSWQDFPGLTRDCDCND